ncbi:hypothetical protein K439DRAFT_1554005, partial [Ramaria rubella]
QNTMDNGPWFTQYGAGPFTSSAQLSEWLNRNVEISVMMDRWSMGKNRFKNEDYFVFTHQDISMRNFILGNDSRIWMIDWELSGFYPRYFEYSSTTFNNSGSRMWDNIVPLLSGYYPTYFKMLDELRWVLIRAHAIQ